MKEIHPRESLKRQTNQKMEQERQTDKIRETKRNDKFVKTKQNK